MKLAEIMLNRKIGGIVLSLNGVQLENGNETLWVVRDVLTGTTLKAENIIVSDTDNLMRLMKPIKDFGIPILGIISDVQKSIRMALEKLFPGIPHQYCHFHYLKDIAVPLTDKY